MKNPNGKYVLHSFPALRCNHWFFSWWMRRGIALGACAITGSWGLAQSSDTIYWPRNDFVIPFQVDSNGHAPQEVHLEVSEDSGQSWSHHTRGDARTRQFQYKAARDGEYIFRLKTVDTSGRHYLNPGPPLRIQVDTKQPKANLVVDLNERGEMLAQFLVSDEALDTNSIVLEYQSDTGSRWVPIPFQLKNSTTPGEYSGFGSWELPPNASQIVVRVLVKDKAGNAAEDTRFPKLPKTAGATHGMQFASQPLSVLPQSPLQLDPSDGRPAISPTISLMDKSPSDKPPSTEQSPNIIFGPSPSKPSGSSLPVRELTDRELESYRNRDGIQFANVRNTPPLTIDSESDGKSDLTPLPRLGAPRHSNTSKTGIEPLHSNTRAFSLDYRIENDPGAPITEVELWGTIDQGRTWEAWGLDPDRKSPFDIEVETDGLFGFRMVIVGANGLASNRPRSGDDADAWIQVDTVQPQARITSALYGKGQEAGALVIEYTVTDPFLPERPISLFFSETPHGPWEAISRGVRNQGRFVWPSTPSLPPKIYLKIDATDLAGNIGSSVLDLPIDVEGIAPRGRIQGFRPLK